MSRRQVILLLTTLYVGALLYVAFWPTPIDAPVKDQIAWVANALHRAGLPKWIGHSGIQVAANVLLFIPLAIVVDCVRSTRPWAILALGFSISVTIELLQLELSPHRFATLSDVAANTAGTALGIALLWLTRVRLNTARESGPRQPTR